VKQTYMMVAWCLTMDGFSLASSTRALLPQPSSDGQQLPNHQDHLVCPQTDISVQYHPRYNRIDTIMSDHVGRVQCRRWRPGQDINGTLNCPSAARDTYGSGQPNDPEVSTHPIQPSTRALWDFADMNTDHLDMRHPQAEA
jgi:hypothetical protein